MQSSFEALVTHLQHLEQQLLQPVIRRNPEAVAALLTDEFREFGSSGRIYTKPEIVAALATEAPRQITFHNFACEQLSDAIALVTYRSQHDTGQALRSSLWIHRDDRWQMLFHQGTKL